MMDYELEKADGQSANRLEITAEMFATMKSVTKYCGVLTIVALCMYALFFVGALGIVGSWA